MKELRYVTSLVDGNLKVFPCQIFLRKMKLRKMRWTGHEGRMAETRNAYKILVGNYEESGLLGKYKCSLVRCFKK
jgi:hypothetical protein